MQNTILSQDELDFLLTGAVKDRPEQSAAAAPAQARQGQQEPEEARAGQARTDQARTGQASQDKASQDKASQPSSAPASPVPGAGPASGGRCGFPQEARLRFARLLQEALQQDGGAPCLVHPEPDGALPAGGWKPCAELVCQGAAAAVSPGACQSGGAPCGLQAGVQIDARLAQALLARELGAGGYELAGRDPTRLEQALLAHALRAVPGCLAGALAGVGGDGGPCRPLGMARPAEPADTPVAGFAVRLGGRAGRLCVALA